MAFAEADDPHHAWQGSQQDLRAMWDSVPRPLLRVGKAGGKCRPTGPVLKDRSCKPVLLTAHGYPLDAV